MPKITHHFFARFCNLYLNCSRFEECWNFEIWRKMLVVWLLPQDSLLSPCWVCEPISLTSKIWISQYFFMRTYGMNFIFLRICKMCLMGDIKVRVYYSISGNAHLSDCGIGILVYVFYETLDFHYDKSFTFQKNLRPGGDLK